MFILPSVLLTDVFYICFKFDIDAYWHHHDYFTNNFFKKKKLNKINCKAWLLNHCFQKIPSRCHENISWILWKILCSIKKMQYECPVKLRGETWFNLLTLNLINMLSSSRRWLKSHRTAVLQTFILCPCLNSHSVLFSFSMSCNQLCSINMTFWRP